MAIKDAERRKAAAIERDRAIDMQRVAILESPPPMGAGFGAIVRSLDANGMHKPASVQQTPQGLVPIFGRHQFMDGEQLVEEVAQRVVQLIFLGAQAQMSEAEAANLPDGAGGEPVDDGEEPVQMFTGEELLEREAAEPLWVPGA